MNCGQAAPGAQMGVPVADSVASPTSVARYEAFDVPWGEREAELGASTGRGCDTLIPDHRIWPRPTRRTTTSSPKRASTRDPSLEVVRRIDRTVGGEGGWRTTITEPSVAARPAATTASPARAAASTSADLWMNVTLTPCPRRSRASEPGPPRYRWAERDSHADDQGASGSPSLVLSPMASVRSRLGIGLLEGG
jgi:hypothetical protein